MAMVVLWIVDCGVEGGEAIAVGKSRMGRRDCVGFAFGMEGGFAEIPERGVNMSSK